MSEAEGIHDHPDLKLGRKPEDKSKPRLRLAQFLKATPPPPAEEDYTAIDNWDMYGNDRYGDCGPCMVAHSRMQVTQYLTGTMQKPTQEDVFDLYKRSGNPGFPSQDEGVILQDMLNEVRKDGIGGVKCVAFARVDETNEEEMDAAIAIFGGLHEGVTLRTAQQTQTVWDFSQTRVWGGHAIYTAGYTAPRRRTISWGDEYEFTDAFEQNQLDEAWIVIWPEHLESKAFMEGVDVNALAAAYKDLTGQELPLPEPPPAPAPEPPAPTPGPEPTPTPPEPAPSPDPDLDGVSAALVNALHEATGEEPRHVRDVHHHGQVYERFFRTSNFQFGVMDKRVDS